MSQALRTRLGAAYDAACDVQIPQDSAGGFVVDSDPDGGAASAALSAERLPGVLRALGLTGSVMEDVAGLLRDAAVTVHDETREKPTKAVERAIFMQAVEAVLEEQGDAPAHSGRRTQRKRARSPPSASDSEEDSGDEYQPGRDDYASGSESPGKASAIPTRARVQTEASGPPQLSDADRERAELFFSLILERLPLVPPTALRHTAKTSAVRGDIDAEEVHTRHIGIDELRYVVQSLGEKIADSELREMLNLAAHKPMQSTDDVRIGLQQFAEMGADNALLE